MNTILWRAWEVLGGVATLKLVNRETAVLLILAASLLIFRTLRERYLMVWIVGWVAYFVSHHELVATGNSAAFGVPVSQVEFVLAVSLFVAGALIYSNGKDLLGPLLGITVALASFAALRALYWPTSPTLRFDLELSYRVLTVGTAIRLLRYRRARREIGPWLLAAGLLLLHLDGWPNGTQISTQVGTLFDMILGMGMLSVVLEESRLHTQRLATLNALTTTIAQAAQNGPMAGTALVELRNLMGANAAWFRLLNGQRLTIFQHIGLSQEFLEERGAVDLDDPAEKVPAEVRPIVVSGKDMGARAFPLFNREKLRQIVVVAVPGRKSLVGNLILGNRRAKSYSPNEMQFLGTCAQQLGLALENLHLVEEILRSHRQWSNTFESIQDVVLLHDSEFHILKANPSLLGRLEKSQAEVLGQLCEAVLPKDELQWANCPYCHGEEDSFYEGPDPFGGYSVASTSTYVDQGTKQKATIHVVRDITERRAAEQKYRSLFEQVQEGVFVTAPDGKLLDCND